MALHRYQEVADPIRKPDNVALFISSEGTDASKATLKRWVTTVLNDAGILAPPGSCRSAATSKALQEKIPIQEILTTAGWKSESTFRRFYQRPFIKPLNLFANRGK